MSISKAKALAAELRQRQHADQGKGTGLCEFFWQCQVITMERGREFRAGCGENAVHCTLPADSGFRKLTQPYSLTPQEQRQLASRQP
jgi:hypothetical protein